MTRPPARAAERGPACLLLLLAFALRAHRLGDASIWWDEGLAVWAARQSLAATTLWTAGDVHPPLFFWFLWPWLRLVGETEFALRFLLVLFGLLAAALGFSLGRRLAGPAGGLAALSLIGLSRFEVWWSSELRMYMVAATALMAAAYAAARWLDGAGAARPDRPWRWLGVYVATAAAALHAVYLAAAGLVALNLGALAVLLRTSRAARGRRAAAWLAAQVGVAALCLPWLALAVPRMQSWSSQSEAPVSAGFVVELWATLLATGVSVDVAAMRPWTALFWAAALGLPAVLAWAARRAGPSSPGPVGRRVAPASAPDAAGRVVPAASAPDAAGRVVSAASAPPAGPRLVSAASACRLLLLPFAVVPPLAVWWATQPRSLFYSPAVEARYLLPFAAPVYVLAACALAAAWRASRPAALVLAALALAPNVAALPGHYEGRHLRDDLPSMALAVWSQAEPGDVVLLVSGDRYPLFLYHYERPWDVPRAPRVREPSAGPGGDGWRPPALPFPDRASAPIEGEAWAARLARVVAQHDRVWLAEVDAHLRDPERRVQGWLNDHVPRVLSEGYGANALHLYDPRGAAPRTTALSGRWPGVVAPATQGRDYHPLVGLPARRLAAGDELHVTLWRRDDAVPADGGTAWVVLASAGSEAYPLVAVPAPLGAGLRARARLAVDGRLPAGRYDVTLVEAGRRRPLASVEVMVSDAPTRAAAAEGPAHGGRWTPPDRHADRASVRLARATIRPPRVRAGDAVAIDMEWLLLPAGLAWAESVLVAAPPTVFVHLVGPRQPGAADGVWAGHDGQPSSGPWSEQPGPRVFDRHVLAVARDTPPGMYAVVVGLYDARTLERWAVTGNEAGSADHAVQVGEVRVVR